MEYVRTYVLETDIHHLIDDGYSFLTYRSKCSYNFAVGILAILIDRASQLHMLFTAILSSRTQYVVELF